MVLWWADRTEGSEGHAEGSERSDEERRGPRRRIGGARERGGASRLRCLLVLFLFLCLCRLSWIFMNFPEKRFSVSEVKHVTWLFRILLRRFLKHTNEPLSSAHVGWHSRYSVLRLGDPPAGLLMTFGIALCGGGLRRLLSFW